VLTAGTPAAVEIGELRLNVSVGVVNLFLHRKRQTATSPDEKGPPSTGPPHPNGKGKRKSRVSAQVAASALIMQTG